MESAYTSPLPTSVGDLFALRAQRYKTNERTAMDNGISKNLQKLDEFLLTGNVSDEAMLLSELDGFLAGVIVCPDLIMPSTWMPAIWAGQPPVYDDMKQAQTINGLIMDHYNDIIESLNDGQYRPVYDIDTDDSILWETWAEGFAGASGLAPDAWHIFIKDQNKDIQTAFFMLARLGQLATYNRDLEPMDMDVELKKLASEIIPLHVETLHHARLSTTPQSPKPANQNQPKVGRNAPCPCGSGKKYKKCCLT